MYFSRSSPERVHNDDRRGASHKILLHTKTESTILYYSSCPETAQQINQQANQRSDPHQNYGLTLKLLYCTLARPTDRVARVAVLQSSVVVVCCHSLPPLLADNKVLHMRMYTQSYIIAFGLVKYFIRARMQCHQLRQRQLELSTPEKWPGTFTD